MKKYFTVLLCTFVFLFNDFSIMNANMFAKDEKVLVKCSYLEEVKQELVEVKQEEAEDTTAIQTSTSDEYIEEDYSPATETNYETFGTYGRLYVSWYDVALYDYNVNTNSTASLQELVDNYDSAAYYYNKGKLVIADHNYQGFSVLGSLSEGTTSYIKFADGSTIGYSLIKKAKGYNTGPDLVDTEGNSFYGMDASLIMYTCYEDGIMVTLWA